MQSALLPASIDHGISILILALAIFLACAHTVMITLSARLGGLGPLARWLAPLLTGAYLATWLAIAIVIGDMARFRPGELTIDRLLAVLIGFGPAVVAALLLFGSRTLRSINAAIPPDWLIWVQIYRLAGGLFLYPFLYYGMLPAGFAIPAAIGDMLTGALAPLIAIAVTRQWGGAVAWAVAWNIFGILDLIVALVTAVASRAPVFGHYPLVLVPLFIGPPLGILTHVYSLRNLAVMRRQGSLGRHTTEEA